MTLSKLASLENDELLELQKYIREIDGFQTKLIFLAGKGCKTRLLHALARCMKTNLINISAVLAQRLAAIPVAERAFSINGLLHEISNSIHTKTPLLLDNLEVLFEPNLKINPLDLIKRLAHSRCIVAVWPGEMRNGRLVYASIGHPEHRDYARDGIVVFEVAQNKGIRKLTT